VTKQYFEIVGSLLEFSADPKLETWVNASTHMHVRNSWQSQEGQSLQGVSTIRRYTLLPTILSNYITYTE